MFKLTKSLETWNSPGFTAAFKQEVGALDVSHLPLQAALTRSSHVAETQIAPVILQSRETATHIRVKSGVFYSGIVAGSCCVDDPTPVCEQQEYCELEFSIDKTTAETRVTLLPD